jgi:hypothetical protein
VISRGERRLALAGLVFFVAVAVGVAAEARRGARRPGLGAGVAVAPFDAGPPPDAGYDAGVWLAAIVTGPSYFHSGGGSAQTRVWTDASFSDAGELLAYQTLDGGTIAAVDNSVGAAASIGAIRAAAEATGSPWILVDWQQPQTPSWQYDVAALETNLTAAAARALDAGYQLCPVGHWEVVGGYYAESAGLPFEDGGTSFAPDSGSHLELIRRDITERLSTHLSTMTDGGGIAPGCATLKYYDLKGPHSGTTTTLVQAAYSEDFADLTSYAPLLDTSGVEVQSDGLHFSQAGHRHAADMLGRTFVRAASGAATPFRPESATVVDGQTIDVTLTVPCRVHGNCVDDPPLLVDTAGRVAQETQGGVVTDGLHFWFGGSLVTPPNPVSSVTPQTCASGSSCVVRYVFSGGLPSFDELSFGDVYCKVFADADCTFGPAGVHGGGSNLVSRVDDICNALPDGGTECYEQPTYNRFSVSYDAGVVVDAGFAASNTQYLAATSGNYVTVANQGGGTAQCIFAWGGLPATNLDTIVRPNSNQRGFLGNIGGTWGCATSATGPTYRVATGSYTTGTFTSGPSRYDVACCYPGGGAGPSGITIWVGGTDVSGTTNGSATALNSDGLTQFPDTNATTTVDEVIVLPGKTTLTAGELLQLRCATKAATDSSPTSGECSGVTTDISAICALATGTRWYGFEGDANDRCGVLNGSAVGTPPYTSY